MVSAGGRSKQSSGSGLDRPLLRAVYPPLPIERSRPSLSVSCKVGASAFKQCPRAPISSGGCDSPAGAYVALAISFPAIRAILLASATAASLGALRSNSAVSQPDGLFAAPRRVCQITAAAPCRRSNARGGRTFCPRAVPLGERTVLLEPQEAPGKLDQAAPHPGLAWLRQPPLSPPGTALIWSAGESGKAGHCSSVAKVTG